MRHVVPQRKQQSPFQQKVVSMSGLAQAVEKALQRISHKNLIEFRPLRLGDIEQTNRSVGVLKISPVNAEVLALLGKSVVIAFILMPNRTNDDLLRVTDFE